jgi:glycine cleavage system H protein
MSPKELRYTKDHEWARAGASGPVTIGITNHAQETLGDIVFVELPKVGDEVEANEPFGTVESVKAVSELFAPVSGKIVAVNEDLDATPELANAEPYGKGWLIKVEPSDRAEIDDLLDATAYDAYVAEGG